MDYTNVKYFLLNSHAEEAQEIGAEYAEDMMRSGCFEKHTMSLYCGENSSRMWIDDNIYSFETLEFYDEAADLLIEKYYITRTAALEIIGVAIEETKTEIHTQIVLLKTCGG
jgi:hypothetical protein